MAKKDHKLDNFEDIDYDLESWDDDFGDDDSELNGKPRSVSSKIKTSLKQSAEQKFKDAKFRREVLKASLPEEYTAVLEDYDAVSKEVGDVWREQKKEWERNRSGIKKAVKPYSQIIGKLGFKKLQSWAEAEDRVSGGSATDDEMDELKVQSLMADVFGDMQDKQTQHLTQLETARQSREDERYADVAADREVTGKRSIEANTHLNNINNGITTLTDYTNKIDFQYKKRSLELQARLLVTQQRALTTLSSFRELAVKELQGIHKNTGLPDYLKIKNDEIITRAFKEKMAENFSAPFNGAGVRLSNRVFGKVKSKLKDWWSTIGEAVTGVNDANEGLADTGGESGGAWGGLKNMFGGAISDWAVNKPAEWAKNKLTPKIREYLEKNHNMVVHGSNLKSVGSQFTDLFNEALKKGETGNATLDKIIDIFGLQEAAITEKNTLWDKKDLDLEKSVYMDNRFKLSVTDVIPGWLKKIYGQVFGINNQGKEAKDLTWDFKSSKFVSTEQSHKDTLDGLVSKDNVKKQEEAIERWVEIIGDGASFSKKTHKFLKGWVVKQVRGSDAINPMKLLSDGLAAPKDVKAELESVITAAYKLTPKQVELAKGGTMAEIANISRQGNVYSNDRLNKTADAANDLKKFSRLIPEDQLIKLASTPEGRAAIVALGIATDNGNGQMQYNYNIDDRIREQFEMGREREHRVNGKKVKDFVGYEQTRHVRNADGSTFLTDDVRSEQLDKQGYNDRDVRLKQGAKFDAGFEYLGMNDEQKFERQILRSLEDVPDPTKLPNYGIDFFFGKDGKLITSAKKGFLRIRAAQAPELHRRIMGFARGGRIPSLASGGVSQLNSGVTAGQPGDENLVKTHGGEFVVSHDAAKFNVKLLAAINKYGAPLINADGSINSVYHKAFGFDKAKDFAKKTGKDLTTGAGNFKNEQAEIVIKSILSRLNFSTPRSGLAKEIAEITNSKIPAEKRLAKALKLWSESEKETAKSLGVAGYGKRLAQSGINVAGGKFDQWLDSDGTGTNIEIKNQLLTGAKNVGRKGYNNLTSFAGGLKDKTRNMMIDRGQTMDAISKTLAEVEKPQMFTLPIDLYFKGRGKPFLTKQGFKTGEYVDQTTGAIIKNPSNIMGAIVDREGSVIASMDDLITGEIVTRSGKPYRLLGLEEKHRKYQTASEYVANRYSIIASSQRVTDAIQKGKDFRDKYLRDEAVDCYLRGDLVTPKLRASGFKDGQYMDQATGNVLWTHHDITGAVVDATNGNIIVSAEDIADGLFTATGEHLKINKFKQVRNMAFRRGAETYNKYAAKHVTRFKNVALSGMSAMGEKRVGLNFDDNPVDVYVKGDSQPRISFAMFKSGAIIDVKSGKAIKSHSGIQGPVISSATNNQLITEEDLKTGLVDAMGEELYLPKMQSAGSRFKNYLKEAILPKGKFGGLRNFLTMSPAKRMEEMNKLIDKHGIAFDVYVKGEPLTPRLTKIGFEGSKYISAKTGTALKLPDFIDGPVLDLDGNQILSAEEIAKGLVTIDGKKVKIGVDLNSGGLLSNLLGSASIMGRIKDKRGLLLRGLGGSTPPPEPEEAKVDRNVLYTIKFKNKKGQPLDSQAARVNNRMFTQEDIANGMLVSVDYTDGKSKTEIIDDVENIDGTTWLKSAMSNKLTDGINFLMVFSNGGYIIDDEGKVIKTAYHTGKKKGKIPKLDTMGASPLKGMFGGAFDKILDKFGIKDRLGSWRQQREEKAKAKLDGKPVENGKKEKKDSWIGKFIKRLTLPLTAMFGGLASGIGALKASLLGGLAWLGQSIVSKSLMGGLGSFIGRSGLGRALAVGAVTYGGIKAYNYMDGSAAGSSSYGPGATNASMAGLDTTSKIMHMSDAAQAAPGKTSSGFLDTITSNPEMASALAMGAMMMPGAIGKVGKGAWWLGKKAVAGTGKVASWGARKLGMGAARAGGAAAGRAPGLLGRVGRAAGSAWRMTGGGMGAAARLAPLLAGAGGLILPAALVGGALVAGWYAGKGLMKLWNNHKNPWNRFRMAQYGFNHNNEELMGKIAKIETVAASMITISGDNQPKLKTDEKAMVEILKICGIYDEQGKIIKEQEGRLENFAIWFKERFLRVYASYITCLKRIRGKAEMMDLSTLNRKEQQTLAKDVHFTNLTGSPYVILQSPFEDPAETTMDATDVDTIFRKLTNKIETSKDIPEGEVKDYSKIKSEDGLDKPITVKPLPKDATQEEKIKHEMDKQLAAQTPAQQDAKTIVDKANAAVKYQADAATLLTKAHNAEIKTVTEKATQESDSLFSKAMGSLQEKFSNFLSASQTAASKIFSGTASGLVDGVGDVAGIVGGGVGNSIYSGGQALLDTLKGSNKGAEKNLIELAMKNGVTDPKELTMLLAQASHESGGFKHSREVGNDAYFAKYNGRKDLGNGPNDGARYKGRGWIQLTGRANYAAFSKWAGIDAVSNPEMIEKEPYASLATIWYWTQSHNMKRFGRKAAIAGDVKGATKAVNGGTNGLKDRQDKYAKYSGMIGNDVNAFLTKLGGTAPAKTAGDAPAAKGGTPFMLANAGANGPATKQAASIVGGALSNMGMPFGGKTQANAGVSPQMSNTTNTAGSADWDFDKIAKAALSNKLPKAAGKCAEYVRKALTAGDLKAKIQKQFGGKLGHAFEYLSKLPKLGFNRVYSGQFLKGFSLMKGDVVVFDRGIYGADKKSGGGWVYGHVAIWTGGNWVSDFVQSGIYPHSKYASKGIPFTIFRANGVAKEKVVDCKVPGDEDFGKPLTQSTQVNAQAQAKQDQATQITPASKVNDTVNGLNNGGYNNSAAPTQAPTQANPLDGSGGGEVVNLLTKQLNVQEQMLSVLRDIAKGSGLSNANATSDTKQGMTTPNLSAIRNEKSMFEGVKNPVSVLKPV